MGIYRYLEGPCDARKRPCFVISLICCQSTELIENEQPPTENNKHIENPRHYVGLYP